MDSNRGDDLQGHHNEGEQDASDGKYNPPHTIVPVLDHILYPGIIEEMEEDNEAYNEGWSHTYGQQ